MSTTTNNNKVYEFYGTQSPNVSKVRLMFKSLGIDDQVIYHNIDWRKGEQYSADYVKINPNSKMPAIIDKSDPNDPVTVFESGNILLYLADKHKQFIPTSSFKLRTECLNWVFWQMANLGPIMGQYVHFNHLAEQKCEYSIQRYFNELRRLLHVLDSHLEGREYVAANMYTIADMCIYPWIARLPVRVPSLDLQAEFPHLVKWVKQLKTVQSVAQWEREDEEARKQSPWVDPSAEERKYMYGRDGREPTTSTTSLQ
ncbi:hypothetical protein SAMD00019534_002250 [Acytostelium subglobosum LB1]|uniref:hypothetical protein n=1 Tax=Acytostelium subglobosum LB1 TaxID=1410327 RepID=UPI000644C19A|nr:hypothetical protein SAMD00019534_002250 [Acytostelium subglobosum LB1]GAM17050.1 hypothetical protein SAMD00019534_002250 [Acytostelium subglobosum LB1]|eukprot:XP_012759112.1 hypothetical protein SAMD00019534_002250 [Acytostelium subglobosum LB1]